MKIQLALTLLYVKMTLVQHDERDAAVHTLCMGYTDKTGLDLA